MRRNEKQAHEEMMTLSSDIKERLMDWKLKVNN